jgi:hypothetical protein
MAELMLIVGAVTLFVGGFAAWYTLWHLRVESSFERVPIEAGRSIHVVRKGISLGSDRS